MPAPSTIVTFTDADGDEFPVRLFGHPAEDPANQEAEKKAARKELDRYIAEGFCSPTMPVTITKVEGI